jgi:hypothetical protein
VIQYTLATHAEDEVLRTLLRDNSMSSWVSLTMEREPVFFSRIHNPSLDFAVLAKDAAKPVGMYTFSLINVYLNGAPLCIGYLGGLRVSRDYRHKLKILVDGYSSIKQLIPLANSSLWVTSIANDNFEARKLLEANVKGLPNYHFVGDLITCAISVDQGKSYGLWRVATQRDTPALLNFHNAQASKLNAAPQLTLELLKIVGIENFLIYGDEEIEACVALWNQASYKQVVVRGYKPIVKILRPLYNLYAWLSGRPRLPNIGSPLHQTYLAFAAFSDHLKNNIIKLLQDALARCNTEIATIGLHASHSTLGLLSCLKPTTYPTRLYVVSYDDMPILDGRPIQPEIALL